MSLYSCRVRAAAKMLRQALGVQTRTPELQHPTCHRPATPPLSSSQHELLSVRCQVRAEAPMVEELAAAAGQLVHAKLWLQTARTEVRFRACSTQLPFCLLEIHLDELY